MKVYYFVDKKGYFCAIMAHSLERAKSFLPHSEFEFVRTFQEGEAIMGKDDIVISILNML